MPKRIVIIQGHPDSRQQHYGHALAAAYEKGAQQAGHVVDSIIVADLEFPPLAQLRGVLPTFFYRWYFRAHSLKSFERNILRFCGISRINESLIGLVKANDAVREGWLQRLYELGRAAR